MAEAATSSLIAPKPLLCRYYLSGACREGPNCTFSHDRINATPDNVCRYYLKGSCSYGPRCRYDHVRPDKTGATNRMSPPTGKNFHSEIKVPQLPPQCSSSASSTGRMTVLRRQGQSSDSGLGDEAPRVRPGSPDWVNAPEFVPRAHRSYAEIIKPNFASSDDLEPEPEAQDSNKIGSLLCPYAMMGECEYGDQCIYLHGDVCDFCGHACLHPYDEEQRMQHREECIKEHERDMELSFAVQRSIDKTCGVCMDIVLEKEPPSERRFGILEKCNHVFCLSCIRKWRNTKQFENRTIREKTCPVYRACPECRVASDFVTPSKYWVETKDEKEKLISDYKKALSAKPCKYFKQGRGECPFAGACFYLHAYPDGTKAEMPPPQRRRRKNQDGEWETVERIFLWDFFEMRDDHVLLHLDLEDMYNISLFSESDDESDLSDYDLTDD